LQKLLFSVLTGIFLFGIIGNSQLVYGEKFVIDDNDYELTGAFSEIFSFELFPGAYGGTGPPEPPPSDTPVSIVLMKITDKCKIFKINKGVTAGGQDLLIRTVLVKFPPGTIQQPTTIAPPTTRTFGADFDRFDYKPTKLKVPTTPPMATLTVCRISSEVEFLIQVSTEPKFQIGALIVHEVFSDAPEADSFRFRSQFIVPKELPENCNEQVMVTSTNVLGTLMISCEDGPGDTSKVIVVGDVSDPSMPAITAIVIDPLGDTFLLVTEVCILFLDDSFICPTDTDLNFSFDLPTIPIEPVGGELIPLDSTMVLAAGAQYTAVWIIPVIVSAIGIGIVIARKF